MTHGRWLTLVVSFVLLAAPLHAADVPSSARRVVLVIDGSGSMEETVGGYGLGESLASFARKLAPDDRLAVIVFDDRAAVVRTPSAVGGDAGAIATQLQGITYSGTHSDIPAALSLAATMFPSEAGAQPVDVILVTDGVVTAKAPRTSAQAVAELQGVVVPQYVASGTRINVIGLGGAKVAHEELQALAESTNGRSEFPLKADRLASFLDAYVEATKPPPPRVVETRVEPPPAPAVVTPQVEPASGMPGWFVPALVGLFVIAALAIGWLLWSRRRSVVDDVGQLGILTLRQMPAGVDHQLKLPVTLGRSPSSPIMIEDREASRKHVRIELLDGKLVAIDLGSSNGTFVNGDRLKENEPRTLKAGDRLAVPGLEFLVRPDAFDADSTYIRQDLDRTFIRPMPTPGSDTSSSKAGNA